MVLLHSRFKLVQFNWFNVFTLFFIKYSAYVIYPISGFLLSLLLTRLCINLLPAIGLIDNPVGGRHIHKMAMPKGGGLAIVAAFFIIWLSFLFSDWGYFIGALRFDIFCKIGVLSFFIVVLGIVDDKHELKAKVKFFSQILIAAMCWIWGIRLESIFGIQLTDTLSLILTVFWIVSFINAFNLIDGMDGLAAGLGVISAICMATVFAFGHSPNDTVVILCLAACCSGFLFYNFHPAKIFLGDTGSMFLGFVFAVIGIVSSNKSAAATSILIPMLAAGVPILDVLLAIWRRLSRRLILQGRENAKSQISEGDKEHLHHRLWEKGGRNQKNATLKLYLLATTFACVAILNIMRNNLLVGFSYILILLLVYTVVRRIAHIELWNTGKAILNGFNLPRKSVILRAMQPFFDIAGVAFIYLFCRLLFIDSAYNESSPMLWYVCTVLTVAPIVLALSLGGSYGRNWMHGSAPDYVHFIKCLCAGFILLIILDFMFGIKGWRGYVSEHLLFFSMTTLALLGARLFLRYLKHHLMNEFYIGKSYGIAIQKILLCGVSVDCRYFIANQERILEELPSKIVGIIEEDPEMQGHHVFGLELLGGPADIEKIYGETKFDKITITRTMSMSAKQLIADFCKEKKIPLTEWKGKESTVLGMSRISI